MQDRKYQKKKVAVEKFIKKFGKVDHYVILNNIDVDYDTLMRILSELRNEGAFHDDDDDKDLMQRQRIKKQTKKEMKGRSDRAFSFQVCPEHPRHLFVLFYRIL